MSSPITFTCGFPAVRQLLSEQTTDLRTLDLDGFRQWLGQHLSRWQTDPIFAQRVRVRDLRRASPQLRVAEHVRRQALDSEAASTQSTRLRELARLLFDTEQAVTGLSAALKESSPERRTSLQAKLAEFQARLRNLSAEQTELQASSASWEFLQQANAELQQIRSAIGIEREEAHLEELQQEQGRRAGRLGESFEDLALGLTRAHIIPGLLRGEQRDEAIQRLRLLRGVTLGAARLELDQVVVRLPRRSDGLVRALAVIEVKRNINDLGHGFRLRQENLGWLTGNADKYDPELTQTRDYRTGHFDREAVHEENGETFRFTRSSFRLFRPKASGMVLNRLYFITRAGPVWGVSAADLNRISYRIATDEQWAPDNEAYLSRLLSWCQSLAAPIETPDVLQMYAAPELAQRVLLVGR